MDYYPTEKWMDSAACSEVGSDVMFPTDGHGLVVSKAICERCPVRVPCLEYALDHHIAWGTWGGAGENERRRIRRRRRKVSA